MLNRLPLGDSESPSFFLAANRSLEPSSGNPCPSRSFLSSCPMPLCRDGAWNDGPPAAASHVRGCVIPSHAKQCTSRAG